MKNKTLYAILAALLLTTVGYTQFPSNPPFPVQQSATMLNAGTKACTTANAVAGQTTCTMTPAAGNFVYITAIFLQACGDATGTLQTNVSWTTTGLQNNPILWANSDTVAASLDVCKEVIIIPPTPIRSSSAGTAVTIVSPGAAAHTAFVIDAFWYEAQ